MKRFFLLCLTTILSIATWAYTFSDDSQGYTIYYNVLDDTSVETTYASTSYNSYSGSVTIPETVTYEEQEYSVVSIGEYTFRNCSDLTEVTIPGSVVSIGYCAFYNSSALTEITIPDNVTTVESGAFERCSGLKKLVVGSGVTSIEQETFAYCSDLSEVTLGENVSVVGQWAFYECYALKNVTFPECLTELVWGAFYGCTGLTEVTIPDNVTRIGGYVFQYCSSLEKVSIGECCTFIGNYAFWGCEKLTAIEIPESVTMLGDGVFGYTGLMSVDIPNSVEVIGYYAFQACEALTMVTLGSGLLSIGICPFLSCTALTTITVSEDNQYYCTEGNVLFDKDKTTLVQYPIGVEDSSYDVPSTVSTIGEYAFGYSHNLTSINLPENLSTMGEGAFYDCEALKAIVIPDNVTTIEDYSFYTCYALSTATIGKGVTSIGYAAFYGCERLTNIDIPDNVTTIGEASFGYNLSLGSVKLGNGLKTIGTNAFYHCETLNILTIPDSVTLIGRNAFESCYTLLSLTIGNGVTDIGYAAFESCYDLSFVTIGSSVSSIDNFAFWYCSSGMAVTMLNPTPPTITSSTFTYDNAVVSVPAGTLAEYKQVWGEKPSGVSSYSELSYAVLKLSLSDEQGIGYATYYNEDYDVTLPEGITAYWAESVENDEVNLTEIVGSVPAKTAVVLKGVMTNYAKATATKSKSTASGYSDNMLHGHSTTGMLEEEIGEGGYLYYTLKTDDNGRNLGFYWGATDGGAFTSKANEAWLATANTTSDVLYINVEEGDDTNGITSTSINASCVEGIYSTSGQKLNSTVKGVNIIHYSDGSVKKIYVK